MPDLPLFFPLPVLRGHALGARRGPHQPCIGVRGADAVVGAARRAVACHGFARVTASGAGAEPAVGPADHGWPRRMFLTYASLVIGAGTHVTWTPSPTTGGGAVSTSNGSPNRMDRCWEPRGRSTAAPCWVRPSSRRLSEKWNVSAPELRDALLKNACRPTEITDSGTPRSHRPEGAEQAAAFACFAELDRTARSTFDWWPPPEGATSRQRPASQRRGAGKTRHLTHTNGTKRISRWGR